MKLTTFFTLPLLLAAIATSSALAADGGPMSGGILATNPNARAPHTESLAADGGPKTGDTASVNPGSVTTAPPATATTAPVTTAAPLTPSPPASSADEPPKSGGEASTNPFSRRTTAPPPALTTATPLTTKPASTEPSSNSASSDDASVATTKTPAPALTMATKTPAPAPSQSVSGESVDFSLINGDAKAGEMIGEVSPDHNLEASDASASASSSNSTSTRDNAPEGETANEAELPAKDTESKTETSGPLAATPSPVSTRNASNSKGISAAVRSGHSSLAAVVGATMAASAILSAVGF